MSSENPNFNKGIMPMATDTRIGGTRVASLPVSAPDRPRVEVKKPVKGKGLTGVRLFLGGLAALGAVETGGAVYTEYTNNVPLSADIPTLIQDVVWPKTLLDNTILKEKALPNFDSTADRGIVEAGINTVAVSNDVLKNAYEEQVAQNKDSGRPTVLFPIAFTASGQRVGYEYQKPITPLVDSVTGKPITIESPGGIDVMLTKGDAIVVPAENTQIFQSPKANIDGTEYFTGMFMRFEQNGRQFAFAIGGGDVRTFTAQNGVTNAPVIPQTNNWKDDAKNGLILPLGTSAATVNFNPNVPTYINFTVKNPETGRWESIKPIFVTDNSTGQVKLLIPSATQ